MVGAPSPPVSMAPALPPSVYGPVYSCMAPQCIRQCVYGVSMAPRVSAAVSTAPAPLQCLRPCILIK